ncbi:MAG: hypothetical protein QOK48_3521, partial [Blastocatellia bacterium]|nr:hypothetical protein [Blastocatellia bacterium]
MNILKISDELMAGKRRSGVSVPGTYLLSGVSGVSLTLAVSLFLLIPFTSSAIAKAQKRKARPLNHSLSRAEVKTAEARLSELGYGTGRVDGVIDAATRNAL